MTDYEALEREHFGDLDRRTGVYAPKIINDRCSHGKTWSQECPDCALVSAKGLVERWGPAVDEARKVIAESEKEGVKT